MRKWQRCTFLHSMWSSLSLLRNRHPLQGSRLKTVFFEQGTETRTRTQGMGCFSTWFQGSSSWLAETVAGSADVRRVLRTGVLWQLRFGLGYSHVMPFSSGLHISTSSPTYTPETIQRPLAPIEERRGDGDVCASSLPPLAAYIRHFPLVPVQRQSNELPATTVGECRRRHSL